MGTSRRRLTLLAVRVLASVALLGVSCAIATDQESAHDASGVTAVPVPTTVDESTPAPTVPPTLAVPPVLAEPTPLLAPTETPVPTLEPTPWLDLGAWPADCPRIDVAVPNPDRPRYQVALNVDLATSVITGSQRVEFTPDLPVDELVFRLWPNGPRPAAAGNHIEISDLRMDGATAVFDQPTPTLVRIPLPQTAAANESIVVSLAFDFRVGAPNRGRMAAGTDWLRVGSFLPMLAWQPGIGWATEAPTSGFAEVVASPAADFDVTVTGTDDLDVLATGEQTSPGRWQGSGVRDFAISLGGFESVTTEAFVPHRVQVTVARESMLPDDLDAYAERITASLEFFAERWGPYPWSTLSVALTPQLRGGIEFPTHIMQGPGSIGRTTPHEVAHQWFYALVGNNQGLHPWLDEGLASYAEFRFEGVAAADRPIPTSVVGLAGEPMSFWESRLGDYYTSVYVQPAVALLQASDGDTASIDCVLRRYVAANAWSIAEPADFFAAADGVMVGLADELALAGLTD